MSARIKARRWVWCYHPPGVRVWVTPDWFWLAWFSRSGFCYASSRHEFVSQAGAAQKREVMARVWEGPVKRKSVANMKGTRLHADPDKLLKIYPNLQEFLTAAVFEDGVEVREAPTVTMWCAGGLWKVAVKDRAEGLVLWLSESSLAALLDLLEAMVLSEDAPWRHDDQAHERNGKRKKKDA